MASSPPRQSPQRLVEMFVPQCDGSYGQCSRAAESLRAAGDGSSGRGAADAAAEFLQQVRQRQDVPPVEDVIRWREFRRRQKMEMQDKNNDLRRQPQQHEMDQPPSQVHHEMMHQNQKMGGNTNRRSLGEKLSIIVDCDARGANALMAASTARSSVGGGASLPSCGGGNDGGDSHSLSFSESTSMGNHDMMKQNYSLKASATADTVSQTMTSSSVGTHSNAVKETSPASADMGGAVIEIIDTEGFPVFSPTSIASGMSNDDYDERLDVMNGKNAITTTAQSASSTSQSSKGSGAMEQSNNNFDDLVKEVDDFFSTLDCTLDAIAKRTTKYKTAPISSSSSSGAGAIATLTTSMSDEPVSEVATDIVSNTARYVADQSKRMARRMMLTMEEDTTTDIDCTLTITNVDNANDKGKRCGITSPCSTSGGDTTSVAKASTSLPINSTPGIIDSKGMPRLLTPPIASTSTANHQIQLAVTPSFGTFSSALKSTPTTPKVEPSPGWDCTKTTVSSDLLESVLATPKDKGVMEELNPITESPIDGGERCCSNVVPDEEGCTENENVKDISTVSSNWDPLQVSISQEVGIVGVDSEKAGDSEIRDRDMGGTANGQNDGRTSTLSPSEMSNNSRQSFTSTSSTFGEAPTIAEVTNFMSQLKQLREENSSITKSKATDIECMERPPVESERASGLHEDIGDCSVPLLEYKEWLRQHKLDTNRTNSVIYEQLRAIRRKVYGESDDNGNAETERNRDQDEGNRSPGESETLLVGDVRSFVSKNSGDERRSESTSKDGYKNAAADDIDRTPVKVLPQECECFPTDEKNMSLPSLATAPAEQAKEGPGCSIPLSPLVPAARWSGGLARWGPSNEANTLPSPPLQQSMPAPEKKLNIAINEDDFSFKPPSLAGPAGNTIVISPIVVGTVATSIEKNSSNTRFNFAFSPDERNSKTEEPSSSPMGSISTNSPSSKLGTNASAKPAFSPSSKISLSPVTSKQRSNIPVRANKPSAVPFDESNCAVPGSDGLIFSSIPEEVQSCARKLTPSEGLQIIASPDSESPKIANSVQRQPKESSEASSGPYASSSASPDMSEGDKGGGFSYSYPLLRSDITTTSSKFVELGQEKTTQNLLAGKEEQEDTNASSSSPSLLGVTVLGSKLKKRKKSKQKKACSSLKAQSEEEQDSLCSSHESESMSSNHEIIGESSGDGSVRKPLDPDGYDWKEIDSKQKSVDATTTAIGQLDAIPENEDLDILAEAEKKCSTPAGEDNVQSDSPQHNLNKHGRTCDPAPVNTAGEECIASLGRVNTKLTSARNVNHLASRNELDVTSDTIYLTPRSALSKSGCSGEPTQGVSVGSSVRELQSVFMTSEGASSSMRKDYLRRAPSVQSSVDNPSKATMDIPGPGLASTSYGNASFSVPENRVHSPPPDSTSIVEILNVTSEDDMNCSKASETKSIKELRSMFEPLQKESLNIREGFRYQFNGSTVIGRGIYLKNREIQAMSSLGSETYDTLESSTGKTTTNESTIDEGSVGDGTLDTNKILRYAKRLEQKGQAAEEHDSFKSFGSAIEKKDTSNSSKENQTRTGGGKSIHSGNIAHEDGSIPHNSSLESLKNVFESKRIGRSVAHSVVQEQSAAKEPDHHNKQAHEQKKSTNDSWLVRKRDLSLRANKAMPSSNGDVSSAVPVHAESPATSVKDRIAVFSGKKASQVGIHSQSPVRVPRPFASPNKVVVPLQQQSSVGMNRGPNQGSSFNRQPQLIRGPSRNTAPMQHQSQTPPRNINMNQAAATPSPIQLTNQSNWSNSPVGAYGIHPSPYLLPNHGTRQSYNASTPPIRFPAPNRPAPVLTRNESQNAPNYEDDDGITLSPTFSEVSGLTLPTCLGTLTCDSSTQSTLFDNLSRNGTLFHETMSPIARHRKQQASTGISAGGAKLSSHPYMRRLKVSASQSTFDKKPSNNTIDSADRLHEIKTPRARGSPNISQEHATVSRREQIVSRVRSSPRYMRSPRDSAPGMNSNLSKPSSQGWQERNNNPRQQWQDRNIIVENSNSLSSSGDNNSTIFHFDGRGKGPEKARGRVSETVERVSKKSVKDTRSSYHQHEQQRGRLRQSGGDRRGQRGGHAQNEEQGNSLATTECIRIA